MAVKTVQVVINNQTYNATYDTATGKYKATITAPNTSSYNINTEHYYPITVKATDDAGNTKTENDKTTLGANLRIRVKETVKPIISPTSPSSGALLTTNKPTFQWDVTDTGAGIDPETIGIALDSGTRVTGNSISKSNITNGFRCTYTPGAALGDGAHTARFYTSDYDGNEAEQESVAFKVDTVPPTLNVVAPANNTETNNKSCIVSGTTADATSSPVTLKVNGNSVAVAADGTFSTSINLTEGENTVTIVATDGAGKTTTVTRKVILDTVAPVIKSVTISKSVCNTGDTVTITIEVTD